MAQVSVTVNGRRYEISCDDGQEAHVFRLAEQIDGRVAKLVASVGHVGDARLLLLASMLLADESEEMRNELARLRAGETPNDGAGSGIPVDAAGALGGALLGLAERIEAIADRLGSEPVIAGQPDPA